MNYNSNQSVESVELATTLIAFYGHLLWGDINWMYVQFSSSSDLQNLVYVDEFCQHFMFIRLLAVTGECGLVLECCISMGERRKGIVRIEQ